MFSDNMVNLNVTIHHKNFLFKSRGDSRIACSRFIAIINKMVSNVYLYTYYENYKYLIKILLWYIIGRFMNRPYDLSIQMMIILNHQL